MAPMTDTSTVPTPAAAGPADQPSVALTIAGSEATGGAGAQADLKTFQELGVFGSLALTCIVSFDPSADWGHRLFPVPQDVLREQLEAKERETRRAAMDRMRFVAYLEEGLAMLGALPPTAEPPEPPLIETEGGDEIA